MLRKMVLVIAPLTLLSMGACGGDDSASSTTGSTTTTTTTTATTPTVTSVADPAVATAVPSSDSNYQWGASFTVKLTETAGGAATISSLTADLQQAAGGIVIVPPTGLDESFRFQVKAAGNRLDAMGSASIDFNFLYTLPNGGREALVSVVFNLVDDNGAATQVTVKVRTI